MTSVAIVPHTHWDREWYASYQTFRLRLVAMLDEFLPFLEREPGYTRFLLDGQTAVIDDYLEIRPEAEATLRRLAASGRLSVGPWMILMDEFMVSGETIVRNLQYGLARASEFGGAMAVGYLPDMFGHVAQMPQILAAAGFEHAVVWRGVPAAIDRNAFWWRALDGSCVRAEYLYGSYSNGRDIPSDAKDLVQRARDYEVELGSARVGDLLLMNGTDHQSPQPWLGRVVAEANALQDDYEFVVTSLPEYVATQPSDALPAWTGELRSGARANLLMGVGSNRVDVHQACARAERALERVAEPLSALLVPHDRYPAALLRTAWHALVLNSAHDSSCACSHDEVVDQVLVRYHEARQIAEGLSRAAVTTLGTTIDADAGSTIVVNPTAAHRRGLVSVPVRGVDPVRVTDHEGRTVPHQILGARTGLGFNTMTIASKSGWVLDMIRGQEFAGFAAGGWTCEPHPDGGWSITVMPAYGEQPAIALDELRERIMQLAHDEADATLRYAVTGVSVRDVVFLTDPVAGFGWTTYRVGETAAADDARLTDVAPVQGGDAWLDNGLVRVEVDPSDGTFALRTADMACGGLHRLVDGGDGGDTYNYSPPAADLEVGPETVTVAVTAAGPLLGRLEITTTLRVPAFAEGDEVATTARAATLVDLTVTTTLELRAGEPFVRVHDEFVNTARDHRLRAHFPLPAPVAGSDAECAFAVVHRGLTAEGGPQEAALPTFPSRRFVDASDGERGLALVHDGLLEYEVIDDGATLALTLLRATGWLSRLMPSLRPNPAGPPVPVPGAQLLTRCVADYAVLLHTGDWRAAALYDIADAVLVPFGRARGGGLHRTTPPVGSALTVDGAVVSAVRRDDAGHLEVRVVNPSDEPTPVTVSYRDAPARGWTVDLRGRALAPFDATVVAQPWAIVTLRLTEP